MGFGLKKGKKRSGGFGSGTRGAGSTGLRVKKGRDGKWSGIRGAGCRGSVARAAGSRGSVG